MADISQKAADTIVKLLTQWEKLQAEKQRAAEEKQKIEEQQTGQQDIDPKIRTVILAWDADSLGNKVAQAERSDDPNEVAAISQKIKSAQAAAVNWITSNNGRLIQEGGDEGAAFLSTDLLEKLDDLRAIYKQESGATLTIGVGEKMSQAVNARALGKLKGKNIVVIWNEQTDAELKALLDQAGQEDEAAKQKKALKKSEPKWKQEGYTLHHSGFTDNNDRYIEARDKDGRRVGEALIDWHPDNNHIFASSVHVDRDHRRKGLATAMYQMAEELTGAKMIPSSEIPEEEKEGVVGSLSPNGKALWAQPNRPFGKSESLYKSAPDNHSEVASIAVRSGSKILMGKRRDNNRWTLAGGHLDQGEEHRWGAARELAEETGIQVDSQDLWHLGSEDVVTFSGKKKKIHAFLYDHRGETPTTCQDPDQECESWEWIDTKDGLPEHVRNNLHSPKNLVLQKLRLLPEEVQKSEPKWSVCDSCDHHGQDVKEYRHKDEQDAAAPTIMLCPGCATEDFEEKRPERTVEPVEKSKSAGWHLIGSAPTKEHLQKLISDWYYSPGIQLHDNGDGTHRVHNAKGAIEGVRVREHKGRWRFERTVEPVEKSEKPFLETLDEIDGILAKANDDWKGMGHGPAVLKDKMQPDQLEVGKVYAHVNHQARNKNMFLVTDLSDGVVGNYVDPAELSRIATWNNAAKRPAKDFALKLKDGESELYAVELPVKKSEDEGSNPFRGWIDPKGGFHPIRNFESHDSELLDTHGYALPEGHPERDTHAESEQAWGRALKEGWIATGNGTDENSDAGAVDTFSAAKEVIEDRSHPASQKLRSMMKRYMVKPQFHTNAMSGADTEHFIRHGILKPHEKIEKTATASHATGPGAVGGGALQEGSQGFVLVHDKADPSVAQANQDLLKEPEKKPVKWGSPAKE